MSKGFVLSFDSILSLTLFILFFTFIFLNSQTTSFKELIALEQGNDLLKIWAIDFKENELKSDVEFFFNNNVTLKLDDKVIIESILKNECVSTSAFILDEELVERKVELIIYFN